MEGNIKEYTTIVGDTWDSISYKLYKTSLAYKSLFELNPDYINTIVFNAGIKIKYKTLNIKADLDIAPWRR